MCVKMHVFLILSGVSCVCFGFELSIIHMNDFHSRYDEMSPNLDDCETNVPCIGGFSRLYTAVNALVRKRANPIVLNAGDNYQGTLWHSIYTWNVTQRFFNLLPLDAMTLGNHEFDETIEGLIPFLKSIKTPIVVANLNDSLEPRLRGLYRHSVVINRGGRKIGIIGVLTTTTSDISRTGKLRILDEAKSVNAEARRLLREESVFTIIVLSHCGYTFEIELAKESIPGISVIVGGHSNTLLYNGVPPVGTTSGPYPTVVRSNFNKTVLVVQADGFGRYLGDLTVNIDYFGQPVKWSGNPVYLDENVSKDHNIDAILSLYRSEVETVGRRVVGSTDVTLDYAPCPYSECVFGDLITDCMRNYYVSRGRDVALTIVNSGAIRTKLKPGYITYKDIKTALPFDDSLTFGYLQGKHLKSVMEKSAAPNFFRKIDFHINLIQVSGAKVIVDMSRAVNSRIISFKIQSSGSKRGVLEDIDLERYYPVGLTTYLSLGGDGYKEISGNLVNRTAEDYLVDVMLEYIKINSPLNVTVDGRISVRGYKGAK